MHVIVPYAEQAAAIANRYRAIPVVAAPALAQAEFFLRTVWAPLPTDLIGASVVGITADDQYLKRGMPHDSTITHWEFTDTREEQIQEALEWASQHNADSELIAKGRGSIFWMGASRKTKVIHRSKGRGRQDELMHVGCVWADIDVALQNANLDNVFETCLKMTPAPTFIVFSGGGLQLVHVFNEAWPITTPEASAQYKLYSRAFYAPLFDILDIEADTKVHNADRMMRLPGFVNRKKSRAGAVASVLWYGDHRYSLADVKATATPHLPAPRPTMITRPERADLPLDSYAVGQRFFAHIVQGAPVPEGERHTMMLTIACDAARAGLPRDQFEKLARPRWKAWGQQGQAEELLDIIEWAYTRDLSWSAQDAIEGDADDVPLIEQPPAEWLIKVKPVPESAAPDTPVSVEIIVDEWETKRRVSEREIELDGPPPAPRAARMTLDALRVEQPMVIQTYLASRTGKGTVLRLKTPPGVGKTHEAVHATVNYALKVLRDQDAELEPGETPDELKNGAIIATLFKMGRAEGREWAKGFGIDPDLHARLFYFFAGRSKDQNSKGYCAKYDLAEAVAAKGRNVITSLCNYCPALQACQERHYLSQFAEAKKAGIVVVRAQHLYMTELTTSRKLILIDESPFGVVAAPTAIPLSDLHLKNTPTTAMDQYPDELIAIEVLLQVIREILAANKKQAHENDTDHIHDGVWLLERIIEKIGEAALAKTVAISKEAINAISKVTVVANQMSLSVIANLPAHFLPTLIGILKHEYGLKKAGAPVWNSRISVTGQALQIYAMEPLKFTQNTRVIVTDATEPDELYPRAFSDMKGRPRQIIPYERSLVPRGTVTVLTGSENTKTGLLKDAADLIKKIDLVKFFRKIRNRDYTFDDTLALAEQVRSVGGPSLAQSMIVIHQLSDKHGGDLMVILYKRLIEAGERPEDEAFLKRWLRSSGILNPNNVQWFGNLRGRNDYKHIKAVLALGTPRMRESDLLMQARAWYWNDPLPLAFDKTIRVEPYLDYIDSKGKGRAYRYLGYKDDRVNHLYLNSMQSELRQCYERIRKNSSPEEKSVYLATAFPCSDTVQEFSIFQSMHVEEVASQQLQHLWDDIETAKAAQPIQTYIDRIVTLAGVSERTAWRTYQRLREEGRDPRDGKPWGNKLAQYEGKNQIESWLAADPTRRSLPTREIHRQMEKDGIKISWSSVQRFFDKRDNHATDDTGSFLPNPNKYINRELAEMNQLTQKTDEKPPRNNV